MQNFFIDTLNTNLQIHSNVGAVPFYLTIPIQGLDFPDLRIGTYDKPGEDGGEISSNYASGHAIVLNGIFQGSSVAQYEYNRQQLISALRVKRSNTGIPQPFRCSFTTLGGSQYFFDAILAKKPGIDWDEVKWGRFLIQLYVKKPVLYAVNQVTSTSLYIATSGGATMPWTLPVTFGASSGGSITVTNNGNGTAVPILHCVGPFTNPQIINATSGLSFKLSYTILAGNYVDIDMNEKLIMLNGTSPIISTKASGSKWWGLDPGPSTVRLLTDSSADSGYVQLEYYHSYAGV